MKIFHNTVVFASLCAAPAWTSAHHGLSTQFDRAGTAEIAGEIAEVMWRNPHVLLTVNVTDDDGRVTSSEVESMSISMMRKRDIHSGLLKADDNVRIAGLPSVRDRNEIYLTTLLLPDGQEVIFGGGTEPRWSNRVVGNSGAQFATEGDASAPERGIFRVWSSTTATPGLSSSVDLNEYLIARTAPVSAPENPPPRAAGAAPAAAPDAQSDLPSARDCVPKSMPAAMYQPYPIEFVRQGDDVELHLEEYDAVRKIDMNADAEPADAVRSLLGVSTGRWEGGTLVVTTKTIRNPALGLSLRLSDAAELVEHFTASADGSRLDYRLTVTDPSIFFAPVPLAKHWLNVPGINVEPYRCEQG